LLLRSAFEHKGNEQFDYLVREQHDELINDKKLADDFLSMYDKLGLLYDENEKQILSLIAHNDDQRNVYGQDILRNNAPENGGSGKAKVMANKDTAKYKERAAEKQKSKQRVKTINGKADTSRNETL